MNVMNERIDGWWVDGCVDGWVDSWMDGYISRYKGNPEGLIHS